jgi:hypothetical protein
LDKYFGGIMGLFGDKENKDAAAEETQEAVGKYSEACSLCGKAPTDKHWAGQYFHKKCLRKMKKGAKGMI